MLRLVRSGDGELGMIITSKSNMNTITSKTNKNIITNKSNKNNGHHSFTIAHIETGSLVHR